MSQLIEKLVEVATTVPAQVEIRNPEQWKRIQQERITRVTRHSAVERLYALAEKWISWKGEGVVVLERRDNGRELKATLDALLRFE